MSRFAKVYEPIEEGWGFLAGLAFQPVGMVLYGVLQWSNFNKIMQNTKVQKYIKTECDKLWAKDVKIYKKAISKNIPGGFKNALKKGKVIGNHRDWVERLKNPRGGEYKVGEYTVVPMGDTDHVESIIVLFYLEDKDEFIGHVLPAPTKDDLKDLGLRREENKTDK